MLFGNKKAIRCDNCDEKINKKYSFCPYCGVDLVDEEDREDFGMLGKNDSDNEIEEQGFDDFGFMEKMMTPIINSMMKNLNKQFSEQFNNGNHADVKTFPNGIRIKIGTPSQESKKVVRKDITDEQIKRISKLPKAEAESDVRRFSDKIIYELKTPGVDSLDDIFVSKLESGYEVKAIGKKKVYVNSLPVQLPLKSYSLDKDKLVFEFKMRQG